MNFHEYIKTELLILIPVLYIIGIVLKNSSLDNKWIPLALGAISIVLSTIWVVSTSDMVTYKEIGTAIFTGITQGVLIAGASVYANQIYVQSKKSKKDSNVSKSNSDK